ncbi:hypothetical protein SMD44_p20040 (plasmid) [Streptomyces alboflavus]|uniref:Uncharacterized protein n=1 Tax=Streptomyces alboflavus TaxID=67267 RepID=A0A291W4I6_9ACTN|nr:hypothetical protein [Streptomyces alboflavus]ATM24823.1 hypothetical protein SMD44_p20040 [Streptomyces alboflavus]
MYPNTEQTPFPHDEGTIDFAAIRLMVECALATPPPPSTDDILFSGSASPHPSVADQTKSLVAALPPLLTACQDAVVSWETEPREMAMALIRDGHALIKRLPVAPNAEQAHAYLQQIAQVTRAAATLTYTSR